MTDPTRSIEDIAETKPRIPILSLRQEAGLAASLYLSLCGAILLSASPSITQSWTKMLARPNITGQTAWQITGSLEQAQAEWDKRTYHLEYMDSSIYPEGKADPKIRIPRDVAAIPDAFFQRVLAIVEEVGGTVSREVLLSFGKIQVNQSRTLPAGGEYMQLVGMDPSYVKIFLNTSPRLQLAACPSCEGKGCPDCNWTGSWGTYPQADRGGIAVPQTCMDELGLTLSYDPVLGRWVGTNVTAFYDLQGGGELGEYTLYVGLGHFPPPQGIPLRIVGVTKSEPYLGLISLEDAWTLKGMEEDRPSSFIYVRIPDIEDFSSTNSKLSPHYAEYGVFVVYPRLVSTSSPANWVPWLPLIALAVSVALILVTLSVRSTRRRRDSQG